MDANIRGLDRRPVDGESNALTEALHAEEGPMNKKLYEEYMDLIDELEVKGDKEAPLLRYSRMCFCVSGTLFSCLSLVLFSESISKSL